MDAVFCTKCGGSNSPNAAFCGVCGTPLPAQGAAGSQGLPAQASNAPAQQPGAYQQSFQPPQGTPPGGYPPPPSGVYPPPGNVYPPSGPAPGSAPVPGGKAMGQNTKWAIGLGVAALFCCGPFTGVPGFIMAKKDMDAFASGQAPYLDEGAAKLAYYLNIGALIVFVLGVCLFWGRLGMLRRF